MDKSMLLFNKMFEIVSKKTNNKEYFSVVNTIDNLEFIYHDLFKNLENNIILEINEELLKEKIYKLINFIKKFPIKDKNLYKHNGTTEKIKAYNGDFSVKKIKIIENILEKENLNLYNKNQEFKTLGYDSFHKIYDFCLDNGKDGYNDKLFRKRKINDIHLIFYINGIIDFFIERKENIEKEKEMYKKKYKYKRMKKKLFLFNVKTSGDYFSYDWCETNTNEFPIIISHIDKELAKRSLYTTYNNGSLYDGLIKDFGKRTINQINSVIIEDKIINKKNIKKAIEYKNEMYKSVYFHYGELFLNLDFKR